MSVVESIDVFELGFATTAAVRTFVSPTASFGLMTYNLVTDDAGEISKDTHGEQNG